MLDLLFSDICVCHFCFFIYCSAYILFILRYFVGDYFYTNFCIHIAVYLTQHVLTSVATTINSTKNRDSSTTFKKHEDHWKDNNNCATIE